MAMPGITADQQKAISQMQETTKFIKAEVHKGDDGSVTIKLLTDNKEAEAAIPQIQQALITSVASTLYTFFGVEGKIV